MASPEFNDQGGVSEAKHKGFVTQVVDLGLQKLLEANKGYKSGASEFVSGHPLSLKSAREEIDRFSASQQKERAEELDQVRALGVVQQTKKVLESQFGRYTMFGKPGATEQKVENQNTKAVDLDKDPRNQKRT